MRYPNPSTNGFGRVSTSPVHLRGLRGLIHLIRMRNGLEMVELSDLGAVLSLQVYPWASKKVNCLLADFTIQL